MHLLKDGRRRVYKKEVEDKYGKNKSIIIDHTLKNPDLLAQFKAKHNKPLPALNHKQIAEAEETQPPDWDALLKSINHLPVGRKSASDYEIAVESLLTALFYPVLDHPQMQRPLHDGRKRVDITYSNIGGEGFFEWLAKHYAAAHIFVECKNYGKEVENPELDQMLGRFSKSRGMCGIIVCRKFRDRARFERRCQDAAKDGKGFVLALDDADFSGLVKQRKTSHDFFVLPLLRQRFEALVM